MIIPHPLRLGKYLKTKKNQFPMGLGKLFYLSFEDALWDILKKKKVKKGSIILLPEYWCGDVQNNIISHGYKYVHYHVTDEFKVNVREIITQIEDLKPAVVLVFHPFGITNSLLKDASWIKHLSKETIFIEDCVHRLVDPKDIKLLTKNHLVMDSLRKVIPLQGSNVYGHQEFLDFKPDIINCSFFYSLGVVLLWGLMQFSLSIGMVKAGERLMKIGYDLIGDSQEGACGWPIFDLFQKYVNYEKVKKIKEIQVLFYERELKNYQKRIYSVGDRGLMKSFPIILPLNKGEKLLGYLRRHGLMTKFELDDSVWSSKQKVLGLPLGVHLKTDDIRQVITVVKKGFESI